MEIKTWKKLTKQYDDVCMFCDGHFMRYAMQKKNYGLSPWYETFGAL